MLGRQGRLETIWDGGGGGGGDRRDERDWGVGAGGRIYVARGASSLASGVVGLGGLPYLPGPRPQSPEPSQNGSTLGFLSSHKKVEDE